MNPITIKTTDLCDACDEAQPCALPFIGFGQRRAFAGSIRTVRVNGDISSIRDMVNQRGEGQVLVIDGGGSMTGALFGDVMAAIVGRNDWAGVVVNGPIRDRVEIDAMDIGVKALGTLPKRAARGGDPGEADVPVSFGGVTFIPGRRLVADEDGVIVLPEGVRESDIDVAGAVAATAAYAVAPTTHRS